MSNKPWSELNEQEWDVLNGVAENPDSWGGSVPTGTERREGEFGPEFEALLKLRDLGLIDFVAPKDVQDVATCTLSELGRKALATRKRN
jgi:hypothetical protein